MSESGITQLIQTHKVGYPLLSEAEWRCIELHLQQYINAFILKQTPPSFAYRNIVESDFTYHRVSFHSFLPQKKQLPQTACLLYSRLYRWHGLLHISARISLP